MKSVDKKGDEVADMPAKQSNLGKTVTDNKLSDRPAERTSLQERLAAMKARVSGTPAGRDAVDKAKGKDQIVAGYKAWQKNFERHVNKGEKAIRILAPAPYKIKEEHDKIDPVTQEIMLDCDGTYIYIV